MEGGTRVVNKRMQAQQHTSLVSFHVFLLVSSSLLLFRNIKVIKEGEGKNYKKRSTFGGACPTK